MDLKKILVTTFISSALFSSFAHALTTCPPESLVAAKAKFTSASIFWEKPIWILWTDNFQYNNKEWNITFLTRIPVTDNKQALIEGQKIFDEKVKLIAPEVEEEGQKVTCVYSENDDYAVGVSTPPFPNN